MTSQEYLSVIRGLSDTTIEGEPSKTELITTQRALVGVHAAALDLPAARWEGEGNEFLLDDYRDSTRSLYASLRRRFGEGDAYYCLEDRELVRRSISDDLSEIAEDLASALVAVEKGLEPSVVLWDLQVLFWTHWGAHLVDVTRRIYQLASDTSLGVV